MSELRASTNVVTHFHHSQTQHDSLPRVLTRATPKWIRISCNMGLSTRKLRDMYKGSNTTKVHRPSVHDLHAPALQVQQSGTMRTRRHPHDTVNMQGVAEVEVRDPGVHLRGLMLVEHDGATLTAE